MTTGCGINHKAQNICTIQLKLSHKTKKYKIYTTEGVDVRYTSIPSPYAIYPNF
jgi:hypothetical protein